MRTCVVVALTPNSVPPAISKESDSRTERRARNALISPSSRPVCPVSLLIKPLGLPHLQFKSTANPPRDRDPAATSKKTLFRPAAPLQPLRKGLRPGYPRHKASLLPNALQTAQEGVGCKWFRSLEGTGRTGVGRVRSHQSFSATCTS